MINEICIENFKSIEKLTLPLGRVTVLIGENGCGKSNILEGIALLAAAASNKLDNEFLASRGIRIGDPEMIKCAFPREGAKKKNNETIHCAAKENDAEFFQSIIPQPTSEGNVNWRCLPAIHKIEVELSHTQDSEPTKTALKTKTEIGEIKDGKLNLTITVNVPNDLKEIDLNQLAKKFERQIVTHLSSSKPETASSLPSLASFLIYSPENTFLRRFEDEGQIQPVGIHGEGLFKMLQAFAREDSSDRLNELKRSLELVGWFLDFTIPSKLAPGENRLRIHDRYLGPKTYIDQRIANEGFLFLIFYFAILISPNTPAFLAIDNIDAALNPKLCAELMRRLSELALKYDKQLILTTHNPAVLDGLNLNNDQERLYTVYRDEAGRTKARRIAPPKAMEGEPPVKLSSAFLQGLIGGLPKNF